jgi:hypothetical protein
MPTAPVKIRAGPVTTRAGPARGRFTPSDFEMERIVSLNDAAMISGLSKDTIKRHYRSWICQLSTRRIGMKLKHVLAIGSGNTSAVSDASNNPA